MDAAEIVPGLVILDAICLIPDKDKLEQDQQLKELKAGKYTKDKEESDDDDKHYAWAIMFSPIDPKYRPVLIHFQFHTSGNASQEIVRSVSNIIVDLIINKFKILAGSFDGDAKLR